MLGVVPDDVVLALRDAVSRSAVDDFWSIWSSNAEAGLFRAYALAGGPIAAGSSAFLGRGLLRIRSRRLGGRAVGGTASSRLYHVCQNDEVDKHCAQYFVNSSLSPVLLFRRRLKSVADVLKGIRGVPYVVMVLVVLSPLFIPGMIGYLRISTAFTSGFLILLRF